LENVTERQGKTTIAPEALVTIARLAAQGVPGVARLGSAPGGVNRWLRGSAGEGARIEVADHTVTAEMYLVIRAGHNVREVSRAVQAEVARALQDMVGMDVLAVNIVIVDVEYADD
jgi:uncharacterized alkaline shock family protein YloU